MIGDVITSLNGTRNYHVVKSWGYKDPKTGKYDGLIGELISGDADFGKNFNLSFIIIWFDLKLIYLFVFNLCSGPIYQLPRYY